jgi:hypothetical protein
MNTTKMTARPVWARREARLVGVVLDPPTELEISDAIRVLEDGVTIPLSLYAEAEAIMLEVTAGRSLTFGELIGRVDEDFIDDRELA